MQVQEMKALRSFCNHKRLFFLNPTKPVHSLSFISRHAPQVSHRHFHSTNPRLRAEPSISAASSSETDPYPSHADNGTQQAPRVWSIYGSDIARTVTKTNEGEVNRGLLDDELEDFEAEKTYGNLKNAEKSVIESSGSEGSLNKANLGNGSRKVLGLGDVIRNKKKGKSKVTWVCVNCGYSDGQWWGVCRSCDTAGTMKRFSEGESKIRGFKVSEDLKGSWLPQESEDVKPVRLTDAMRGINKLNWRIPLPGGFGSEVARVLGGGLVPGLDCIYILPVD